MGYAEDPGSLGALPPAVTRVPSPTRGSPDLAGPVPGGGGQGWRARACWGPRR